MNLQPLNDRVIVQPEPASRMSPGGLHLVADPQKSPQRSTVIAAGPGTYSDKGHFVATTVKPGDIVMHGRHSGTDITVDGVSYLILKEPDIYAILGREEAAQPALGHPYQEEHADVR
jgi:chaperonin GroES